MIKAVIFDYGGVVAGNVNDFYVTNSLGQRVPGDPSIENAVKALCPVYTYEQVLTEIEVDLDKLVRGEIQERVMWERFAKEARIILPPEYETLLGIGFEEIYPENERVVGMIYDLQKRGIVTGVLSTTAKTHADINRRLNRYDKFDPIILSCEVGARKPEERIYKIAAERLAERGISPAESVYIDDVAKYLEPAAELGMKTIHFRNGEHSVDYLRSELEKL